jgi:predicted O-linked N-acetylglucosamine transferase (SPINDLY family)
LYLGTALQARGRLDDAIAAYRNSIRCAPQDAQAYSHLGAALCKKGQPDEAITVLKKAMELRPDLPQAQTNASVAYKDCGQLDEAIACCKRATELRPQSAVAHSNLILLQNYHPDYTAKMLLEETLRWAQRHAEPLAKNFQPHLNERFLHRRLRIGYVSPDINIHPVGRFLVPLLTHHDHQNFEIHCYSDTQQIDPMTAQARKASDHWHEPAGLSDQELADQIRADQIDILIDLSLHTGSRLLVFARKPAPVQVSWLGYPGTTGLAAIDYRLSDPLIDPVGQTESDYVERTLRIPSYWCYQPLQPSPAVGRLPAEKNGQITFGSLSNFSKVTSVALEMWAEILNATSDSRLMLTSNPGQHRERVKRWFTDHGIDPQRILFVDRLPVLEYLAKYNEVDIALDTTPFAGGTTTCDALWMGVPVVTLSGKTAVGRSGVSLLTNVGLPELIAQSPRQYIEIAAGLAKDLPKLAVSRSQLRDKMQSSPLMDIRRFTADIENMYREIWKAR